MNREELEERAEELRDNLQDTEEAVGILLQKVNEFLDYEITIEEYEEWVENNDEIIRQAEL